jgi:ribosomal protein S18 acetylase RimI-like enzyme
MQMRNTMDSSPAAIRCDPPRPEELEILLDMARAFHREDGHVLGAAGEAAIRRIVEGEPLARCWIVRQAGKAVGYLVLTLGYSVEYGGRDGFIDDLYLDKAARGEGLGALILDFAIAEARALGIGTLHLEVDPANERANRLYRARGFAETGRRLMRLPLATR